MRWIKYGLSGVFVCLILFSVSPLRAGEFITLSPQKTEKAVQQSQQRAAPSPQKPFLGPGFFPGQVQDVACNPVQGPKPTDLTVDSMEDPEDPGKPGYGGDNCPGDGLCRAVLNGACTLRAAIQEANTYPNSVTIHVPKGTYSLKRMGTNDADDDTSPEGDLDVNNDMIFIGAGSGATVIDASGMSYFNAAFDIGPKKPGVAVKISGMTITGAYQRGITNKGNLTLDDVILQGNGDPVSSFVQGGAIFNDQGSQLTLTNCALKDNKSKWDGGAIYSGEGVTLSITKSVISNNETTNSMGGGVYCHKGGRVSIAESTISDNKAAGGGGVDMESGCVVKASQSTVSGNSSIWGPGGGFYNSGGNLTLVNSTVDGNRADKSGGGIFLAGNMEATSLTLRNVAIAFNSAYYGKNEGFTGKGGGIYGLGKITVDMKDSLLINNHDESGEAHECAFTPNQIDPIVFKSGGYNLLGAIDQNACPFVSAAGDKVGVDPQIFPAGLGNNGGPTPTRPIRLDSPAVDGGDPNGCTDDQGKVLTTDQRGAQRPLGKACDIGAYEAQ